MSHEALLRVREAAEYLDVHEDTVRRWIDSGRLPSVRVGPFRRVRVRECDVRRLRSSDQAGPMTSATATAVAH
jgi:excisionase family DNA binding protein